MVAVVNPDKCSGCSTCINDCPAAAIELKETVAVVDASACVDCETCIDGCPEGAITMSN
ncbi:MAG TPA: 4Fe-4S binding protein [Methanocorpusculum sp.]|nr:4Fe-4S binding protein [Methanocorpusculum sp.]